MKGRYDGIETSAVVAELDEFLAQTVPVKSGTYTSNPKCGRKQAIQVWERVRPILDQLYPEWRDENSTNTFFEFAAQRDACARLKGRLVSHEEIEGLLAGSSDAPLLAADRFHHLVWSAASAQWMTGHRHEAVAAAAKAVNSQLQQKTDRRDLSETKLVQESFSDKEPVPKKPRLRFPNIEDHQTRASVQAGARDFGAGCFEAIRNPLNHLPNEEFELTEQEALERLAAFSLLARWIDDATLVRVDEDENETV